MKITKYRECMNLSEQLKARKILLHPVIIAEAHDIEVPYRTRGSFPKTSSGYQKMLIKDIKQCDDIAEIAELMSDSFSGPAVVTAGNARMAKLCSGFVQNDDLSLDDLIDLNEHTQAGSLASGIMDKEIHKRLLATHDPNATLGQKIGLVERFANGSKEKAQLVRQILADGDGNATSNDLRRLSVSVCKKIEPELYGEVVRFVISQVSRLS